MRFLDKTLLSSVVLLVMTGCASVNNTGIQKVRIETPDQTGIATVSNTKNDEKTAGRSSSAVAVYQARTYAVMEAPALQGNSNMINSLPADKATVPAPNPAGGSINPEPRIKTIEFQIGVSSVTVEKMAKKVGCSGGKGAGLITPKAAVEVYRMVCDNGRTFVARCETRQCSVM
jgi:hypothetical protein